MTVQSYTRTPLQITEFANNTLVEDLQTIPGVSEFRFGRKRYAMRIWIDPAKLVAKQVTANDVQAALLRENVELPSGKISGNTTELTVRTFGRLTTEEEFNNLIEKCEPGKMFRVKDVRQPRTRE